MMIQGVMLWAFGTRGNIEGAFTSAVSLEHMGYDLFVLDQLKNSVTCLHRRNTAR